jgi:hypothetical protein
MAMLVMTLTQNNAMLLGHIHVEQDIYHIMAKEEHNALLGRLNPALTMTDHLEGELQRMDTWIDMLATTIATEVKAAIIVDLNKFNCHVEGLASSVGHFSLEDGQMAMQVLEVQKGYDACNHRCDW